MGQHLEEIAGYVETRSKPRAIGPFIAAQLRRHGPRDMHFATVWLMNWICRNARLGYAREALDPNAPFTTTLREMVGSSDELARLFHVTPDSLDYNPALSDEQRREIEKIVPDEWLRDADV